jgi:hypothetical protein
MKTRSCNSRLADAMTVMILILTVGLSAVQASQKAELAPTSKLDLGQWRWASGAQQSSHLPKALRPSCKDGWVGNPDPQYSQYAEVEITVTDTLTLRRLRSFPTAPGNRLEVLDGGKRVRVQLPATIVADLIDEGAQVQVLRDFMLWEKSKADTTTVQKGFSAAATCTGSYKEGNNGTNVIIPEGDWTYSGIAISSAPSNAQVTCVDVHYEIIHTNAEDLVVDLTDEDLTYEYHLWNEQAGTSTGINETVTGITLFSGQDPGSPYGAEGVNQTWTLWAFDGYTGDTGYIDTWWIKVYYTVPTSSPAHDACSNAVTVYNNVPYTSSTIGATGSYETQCGFYDMLDVWHVFTATQTGLVTIAATTIDTEGSHPFDTTLAVFSGCGGIELACNDDDCADQPNSRITMRMVSGTTYYIRVAGYDYRTGDYILTVQQRTAETPATPSVPYPSDSATSVETHVVLSWNNSASLVNSLNIAKHASKPAEEETTSPKVIYGKDDRIEEYEVTDSDYLHAGDSTVMLVYWADLTNNGNGTYTLPSKTFAQWYLDLDPLGTGHALCSDEPFRNQPAPGVCTGVLVAPDIIATAGHCAACETISDYAVVFGFVMNNQSTAQLTISENDVYRCSQVVAYHDSYPDWALIRLERNVTTHVPLALRRTGKIADSQALLVVGHPWGIPRKYDDGGIVRDNTQQVFFQANLDTYIGSSGSPVFNQSTLDIEGVLSTGKQDFVTDPGGTCDRSHVCPDSGCPDWETVTRSTAFCDVLPSFDIYLGTSSGSQQLVEAYSAVPWFNPGVLNVDTTYYWHIVARNAWTQVTGPTWSFHTTSASVYQPIFRFWSPTLEHHFYTISESEKNKLINRFSDVWTYEGVGYYAFSTAGQPNTLPVYRFWSPTSESHFYTISESEKNKLINRYSDAWTYEGIVFYAYPEGQQQPGSRPVYRFWSSSKGSHFYTMTESEKDKLVNRYSDVWTYEGVAWYAYE